MRVEVRAVYISKEYKDHISNVRGEGIRTIVDGGLYCISYNPQKIRDSRSTYRAQDTETNEVCFKKGFIVVAAAVEYIVTVVAIRTRRLLILLAKILENFEEIRGQQA